MIDYERYDRVRAVAWTGTRLRLLDQRRLPLGADYVDCTSSDEVARAIRDLVVRGAPAIGIAAAWGAVLAAASAADAPDGRVALRHLEPALSRLQKARPTAVNLAWAMDRIRRALDQFGCDWRDRLRGEAQSIQDEDLAANRLMGQLGAALIEPNSGVLTHCNTGSLATAGFGTALGVIRAGVAEGRIGRVFAGETRPWLQGSRLTVWELQTDGIAATLIADSAAALLMRSGQVQWVIVGADRIAANADTANKIGTYGLAIAARHHGVKFMVVAPACTVDMATANGNAIEIELRDPAELLEYAGQRTVVAGVEAWNPVFDVTPGGLIDVLVTERGVIERPDTSRMNAMFGGGAAADADV